MTLSTWIIFVSIDTADHFALSVVDVGSGLGHLPNLIGQLKNNRYHNHYDQHQNDDHPLKMGKIVAVERDLDLHERSVEHLQVVKNQLVERLCMSVELSRLDELEMKYVVIEIDYYFYFTMMIDINYIFDSLFSLFWFF